ncbi:MAG: T9SS type A sorting domain-containing protein [Bacteroidia bacterium]
MKSKVHFTLLFYFFIVLGNSQSITPHVISASGAYVESASCSMTWTLGEIMTDTYSSADNFFTQGFNQPDTTMITSLPSLYHSGNITIYPNPVINYLIINLSDSPGKHIICFYNMLGQLLLQENIPASQQQLKISLNEFANGLYLLNIISSETNLSNSFKINKAQ